MPGPNALPEHVRFVRGIARSLLFDEHEAEDAVQDTFLRALEQPPRPGNVRGWLRVVVRNFALRKKREERRRKRREMKKAPPDYLASPEEVAARLEGQRRVLDAVRELPEPYRSTIVHRYFDELTREEIAERLGIPLETVRTRLRRALHLLRERLDGEDDTAAWVGALLPLFGLRRVGVAGAASGSVLAGSWLAAKAAAVAAILGAGVLLLYSRDPASATARAAHAAAPALHAAAPSEPALGAAPETSPEAPVVPALAAAGVVRDALGVPVPDACVEAEGGGGLVTDRDGRFRVRAAESDGRARVVVRKPGYLPWQGVLDALSLVEEEITLVRGAPVTVVVLAPDKKPVAGALVQAAIREERGIAGLWWSKRNLGIGEGTSDGLGRVILDAAPAGRVEIRVDDPHYASWRTEIDVAGTDPVRCEAILSRGGAVAGVVTDERGQPVPGARVYASNWPGRTVVTREDGSYDLRFVVEGENRILAEAEGFGTGFFGASFGWGKPVPVHVVAGRTLPDVDLVLVPAIVAAGRVVDGDGQPLAGVRVESIVGPCLGRAVTAMTDAGGRFAVGPYATTDGRGIRLSFALAGYAVDSVSVDAPAQPGTFDLGDVTARRCGGISGVVLDVDGEPLGRCRVEVAPGGGAALTGPDGTFALEGLAPGLAQVQATAWSPLRRSDSVSVTLKPGAREAGLVVRLEAVSAIRGRVVSADGKPRSAMVVAAAPSDDGDRIVARTVTDDAGAFDLVDLPEGTYRVGILRVPMAEETTAPDSRLAFTEEAVSVRLVVPGLDEVEPPEQGTTFLTEPGPVRVATGREDLTFMLPARGTTVDGRVVSHATGRPVASFEVSFIEYWHGLIPKRSETSDVRDAEGRFTHDLKEGSWAAEVTAPGYATYRTPVFAAGDRATWDLGTIRLGPGGSLRGTVRDSVGEPVSYARLYLLGPQLQTNRRPIFTDALGAYEAAALAPGTYTVFVLSPRHPFGIVRNVGIQEDETSVLVIRLGRPSPVTIVVTDEEGRPVADADVSYTCDALMPLTSHLLRSHEPPGWGGFRTDGQGRLFKRYLPATRIQFRVKAEGFGRATRFVELTEDRETVTEIRLERQH